MVEGCCLICYGPDSGEMGVGSWANNIGLWVFHEPSALMDWQCCFGLGRLCWATIICI